MYSLLTKDAEVSFKIDNELISLVLTIFINISSISVFLNEILYSNSIISVLTEIVLHNEDFKVRKDAIILAANLSSDFDLEKNLKFLEAGILEVTVNELKTQKTIDTELLESGLQMIEMFVLFK